MILEAMKHKTRTVYELPFMYQDITEYRFCYYA